VQTWYAECKRYAKSIDWATVWGKIAFSQNAKTDYFLLVTNNNPSPQCESEITKWNLGLNRPKIRVWRGYELQALLRSFPQVAAKYGLTSVPGQVEGGLQSLSMQAMKLTQAAHSAAVFGADSIRELEAASLLGELISLRMDELHRHGRILKLGSAQGTIPLDWLVGQGAGPVTLLPFGTAVIASIFRQVLQAGAVQFEDAENTITLTGLDVRMPLSPAATSLLREVGIWCDIEVVKGEPGESTIQIKARN